METKIKKLQSTEIVRHRQLRDRVLGSGELRAMRAEVQQAYGEWREASRRAAACARHYDGMVDPRGFNRPQQRIVDADSRVEEEYVRWRTLTDSYEARRAALMRAADVDEATACSPTAEETASRRRFEQQMIDYPPIGWGKSTPDYAERCTRWRARSAEDRLRDPQPRDVR